MDNGEASAHLTDLSKTFDCLPHERRMSKMYGYGLGKMSCKHIPSYLDNYHPMKMGSEYIHVMHERFETSETVIPQGPVMSSFSYNAYTNNLILVLLGIGDILTMQTITQPAHMTGMFKMY